MNGIHDDPAAPATILVVDDEIRDQELIRIHFTEEGYQVHCAGSARDALRMIDDRRPDVIVLDVLLPDTDGYHLAAEIKSNPANRNTPILLVTALNDREARLRGLASGADDFLTKPLDGAELRARVRNLLRLKVAYEEVSCRNAEIAAALAEARKAHRAAEEANAAKTHLLRVMSHELRTPLNAITGYAQLLELGVHGELNAEQGQDVTKIKRAAGYLTRLIGDVLTSERFDFARPLELAAVPVSRLLSDVDELCALQAEQGGLALAVVCPAEDMLATGDVERVQQILLNLVTNAMKFTARGGTIRVSCSRTGGTIAMSVRDTGVGISQAQAEWIFEPFTQIDRHLTRVQDRGLGLGLAISRELARAMGGDLTLASKVGEGSTFTLTLPAWQEPGAAHGAAAQVTASSHSHSPAEREW